MVLASFLVTRDPYGIHLSQSLMLANIPKERRRENNRNNNNKTRIRINGKMEKGEVNNRSEGGQVRGS